MLRRFRDWLGLRRRPHGIGGRAEDFAAAWLRTQRSFAIVARNWRNPNDERDELDIVCRDGDVLVFVEVKARSARALVSGYHAVDRRKKRALLRAARTYLARMKPKPRTFRLDIVELALDGAGGPPEVRHFENVPLFPKGYFP